jgi:hypothetical protein
MMQQELELQVPEENHVQESIKEGELPREQTKNDLRF